MRSIRLLGILFCFTFLGLSWAVREEAQEVQAVAEAKEVQAVEGWWDGSNNCYPCNNPCSTSTTTTTTTSTTTTSTTTTSTTTTSTTTTSTTTTSTTTTSTTTTSTTTTSTTTTSTTTTTTTTTTTPPTTITFTTTVTSTESASTRIIILTQTVLPCDFQFETCYHGCPYVDVPQPTGDHHRRRGGRRGVHYEWQKDGADLQGLEKGGLAAAQAKDADEFDEAEEMEWVEEEQGLNPYVDYGARYDHYRRDRGDSRRIFLLPTATEHLPCAQWVPTFPTCGYCNTLPAPITVVMPTMTVPASAIPPSTVYVTLQPTVVCTTVRVCAPTPFGGSQVVINTTFA